MFPEYQDFHADCDRDMYWTMLSGVDVDDIVPPTEDDVFWFL